MGAAPQPVKRIYEAPMPPDAENARTANASLYSNSNSPGTASAPAAGSAGSLRFAVRGVDRSDVLNVRSEPGTNGQVVGQIPPDSRGVVGTGPRRRVGPGMWREVSYGGVRGWVNERFLIEERPSTQSARKPARTR